MIDRLAPRIRPRGIPVLHQRWCNLLFLHWRFSPEAVRPHVPAELGLDLFEGVAWVGLTAFSVSRMHPTFVPPIPMLAEANEINLRTYVHCQGVPGLWFFSLDATNPLAVCGARLMYRLPYFRARMRVTVADEETAFRSVRTHTAAPPATFDAAWRVGALLPEAKPGTREFFLLERYVLYTRLARGLCRARIHHRAWPLREATLRRLESTLLEAAGLRASNPGPLVHAQGAAFDVAIWPPRRVFRG